MKPTLAPLAVVLACATAAFPLAAQTIWRCGPDGRAFQSVPCADGERLALRPPPTPEAVAEAHAVAARERLAIAQLAAERRARERDAAERGLGPAGIRPQAEAPAPKARRVAAQQQEQKHRGKREKKPGRKTDRKPGPQAPAVTPWATAQAPAD